MSAEFKFRQNPLFGEKLMTDCKESVHIGMPAIELVNEIFTFHKVKKFSYTEYDPELTYPLGEDQPLYWDNWSGKQHIQDLSNTVVNRNVQKFKIEGVDLNVHDIMAVCSKVETDKGVKQIPMLDFAFSEIENGIEMVQNIGLPAGVILKTDHSYHYYGLNLIEDKEWEKWFEKLLYLKDTKTLFGDMYLSLCLKRGYSALRVFGYKGTSKSVTPKVISFV